MDGQLTLLHKHIGVHKLYPMLWDDIWDIWGKLAGAWVIIENDNPDTTIAEITMKHREEIHAKLLTVAAQQLLANDMTSTMQPLVNYRFAIYEIACEDAEEQQLDELFLYVCSRSGSP